ncbi:MAG: tRNA(Ile)-lysidine synthase [Pelagibacterales bacterium]|nr:tRNA(Ile)-lysidine synthase [Pelagibacterales bacterium]
MNKKNLSVLNLKNKKKSNKKISEIYAIFKKNLNHIKKNNFIVGVSGGPDSLALAALSKKYEQEKQAKVYYVLVDHGLRKNSATEALKVKKLLKSHKIPLTILTNKKNFNNNIQGKAREIRYKFLLEFCKKKNIKHILTGHHSDDQIETFLIRLSRGSGVQGLSSMRSISKLNKKITLSRPFLDLRKLDLTYVAKKTFGTIFKDPSNLDKKYLRTRIRQLKSSLEKSGVHHEQILKSIKNLASTSNTLNNYINKIYLSNVKKKKKKIIINCKNIFLETEEIQLKILSQALKNFSNSYYPPRSKKVINLLNSIRLKNKKKLTLFGCIIEKTSNYIIISKEA